MEPSTFIRQFKNLPEYPETDMAYFASAICVDSKVTVRLLEGMQDIYEAYDGDNYSPIADDTASTLHNSCMRYPDKARNAADFYANFAGAKSWWQGTRATMCSDVPSCGNMYAVRLMITGWTRFH